MAWVVTAVVAAFEVTATAAVIFTAVSEVGMALTVVGAVTGSKDLMKIGGVLGLAGGIGGMAAGGLFGEAVQGAVTDNIGSSLATAGSQSAAALAADNVATQGMNTFGNAAGNGIVDTSLGGVGQSAALGADQVAAFNPMGAASSPVADQAASAMQPLGAPANLSAANDYGTLSAQAPAVPSVAAPDAQFSLTGPATGTPSLGAAPTGQLGGPNAYGSFANNATGAVSQSPYGLTAANPMPGGAAPGMFDKTMAWVKNLPPIMQAELARSVMAIPGGIQAQNNVAAANAIAQQRVNQTSYGSVPNYFGAGIIANAQKKKGG